MYISRLPTQQYCIYQIQVDGRQQNAKRHANDFYEKIEGTDSVLINKDVNVDSFSLPMSYSLDEDVLFFEIHTLSKQVFKDTVTVSKENRSHFESVDCSPSFFHTITGVKTTHNYIDSIVINQKEVNYDASKAHFYIYFGSRN